MPPEELRQQLTAQQLLIENKKREIYTLERDIARAVIVIKYIEEKCK